MNKLHMKYQILTTICMSNSTFTPTELLEATQGLYDFITEGADMKEADESSVTNMFTVVQ